MLAINKPSVMASVLILFICGMGLNGRSTQVLAFQLDRLPLPAPATAPESPATIAPESSFQFTPPQIGIPGVDSRSENPVAQASFQPLPQPPSSQVPLPAGTVPGTAPVPGATPGQVVAPASPIGVSSQQAGDGGTTAAGVLPSTPGTASPTVAPGTAPSVAPVPTTPVPVVSSAALQAPIGKDGKISIDEVAAFVQQFRAATDVEETVKAEVLNKYEELLNELRQKAEEDRIYSELEMRAKAAPTGIEEARAEKANFRPKQVYQDGFLATELPRTLQSYLAELQSLAQEATDGRTRIEAQVSSRDLIRKELPRLLSEAKAQATQLLEEVKAPEGAPARLREVYPLVHHAKQARVNSRIRRLEQEQRTYDAESDLLTLQASNFSTAEKHYQSKVKEVTDELNKRRESLIARFKRAAERLLPDTPSDLKDKVQQVVRNADDWANLTRMSVNLRLERDSLESDLTSWSKRFSTMKDRISSSGRSSVVNFNSMVGLMLRKQRSELPDVSELKVKLSEYQSQAIEAQAMMLRLEDWKAANSHMGEAGPFRTDQLDGYPNLSPREKSITLYNFENRVVDEFRNDTQAYIDQLFSLDQTTIKLIEVVEEYRTFIDENILWIRSTEPFGASNLKQLWPSIQWLFRLDHWKEVPHALLNDFQDRFWGYLAAFGLILLWVLYIPRFRADLQRQGEIAKRPNCTTMIPTWRSFFCTIILASPISLVALMIGWRLYNWEGSPLKAENIGFASSVGMALMIAARSYFPLEFLRQFCRPGGLAESHFQWAPNTTRLLRSNLRWFIDLMIPSILVIVILNSSDANHENSLGRLLYAASMFISSLFLLRILKPSNGVFTNFLRANRGGWIDRLRYIWYLMIVSSPMALMVMSLMGYHYTSTRLAFYLHTTFVTLTGILVMSCFIYRWLLLKRRELLVAQAKQRLEEARRRDPNSPLPAVSQADTHADLASINKQTVQLISSIFFFGTIGAIMFIWSGVLPAVQMLESFTPFDSQHSEDAITLLDIFLAIPAGVMTVVSARNLPGLLEIALLQHLPLENAVRYAITSISRYTIFILGIVFTSGYLGIEWSSVQWLVAALGVGLGFGLQEIFANFVSGLILLFEQPVRVGDIITLGDTTGTVSRIRMRATTITNFDQQELIIPNKDLVTGRLLNWTLSDTTSRIVMNVGISYETDAELACNILQEICNKHPNVLREPAPTVFVERFDECRLEITIRCFLSSIDLRFPTRHEIYLQMRRRFAQEGITLWLPQREVFTRSESMKLTPVDPDWVEVSEGDEFQEEAASDSPGSSGANLGPGSGSNTASGTRLPDVAENSRGEIRTSASRPEGRGASIRWNNQ